MDVEEEKSGHGTKVVPVDYSEVGTHHFVENGAKMPNGGDPDVLKPSDISLGLKHFSISSINPPKHLLSDVSAFVVKGGITAVMGPSSSGKSLLMKYLCGRLPTLKSTGEVTLCGKVINPLTSNGFGFVPQEDVLIGDITVRETFTIAAELRKDQPLSQCREDVDEIIKTLGLSGVGDNVIGTVLRRGLSGGQKRRTSVGTELVVRPAVVFLDEPTSGLDGTTAYEVIRAIRNFATSSGGDFSVMLSIHQSSIRIQELFDHLLFLGRGGGIFFGTMRQAVAHFTEMGHPPAAHQNPADFFMQVTDENFGFSAHGTDFVQEYATSKMASETIALLDGAKQSRALATTFDDEDDGVGSRNHTGFWRQYITLTKREAIVAMRDVTLYYLQFSLHAFYGFMIGAVFWNAPTILDDTLLYLPGAILWALMLQSYMHVFKVFYLVTSNKRFDHERANDSYSVAAYWCSELTVTAVSHLITVPGFTIAYFMIGFPTTAYGFVIFLSYVMSCAAESMLNFTSKFFGNVSFAIVAAQAVLVVLTVYGGGIFIPFNEVPNYWVWLMQLGIFTQGSRSAMAAIFPHLTYTCPSGSAAAVSGSSGSYECVTLQNNYPCIDGTYDATNESCDSAGPDVLRILTGGTTTDKWMYFGYLVALFAGFRFFVALLEAYPFDRTVLYLKSLVAGPTQATLLEVEMDLRRLRGEVKQLRGKLAEGDEREEAASNIQGWYRKRHDATMGTDHGVSRPLAFPSPAGAASADVSESAGPSQRHISPRRSSFSAASTFLAFEDVTVALPKTGKVLIDRVTGFAVSGRVLAIMGPSGAGKTTLLNALSGRAVYANVSGRLRLGERLMTADDLDYVPQFDDLNEFFTVKELLLYMASMKCTDTKKRRRVNELIHILGLTAKANMRTGDLSGGEKKRVSIGMGMVSQPTVLFLDEPTTGLDSVAAYSVVDYISRVARQTNVITIMTIHQPSGQVFEMLEDLMLLETGRLAYMGTRENAEPYFAALGADAPPAAANRADYYMDLISEPPPPGVASAAASGGKGWKEMYLESRFKVPLPSCMASNTCVTPRVAGRPSLLTKFRVLLNNQLDYYWRNPAVHWLRILELVIVAVYVGTIFPRLNNTVANLTKITGAAFFNIWCVLFAIVASTPSFVVDRRVALQEMLNGAYGAGTYCLAQFTASLPYTVAASIIYQAIFYWLVGFNPAFEPFVFSCFLTVTLLLLMEGIMLSVVQGLKNDMLSCTFSMVVLGMLFLLPGFFIKTDDMVPAVSWLTWIIPTRYAFNGYLYSIFNGQNYAMPDGNGYITGDEILTGFFAQSSNEGSWQNFGIMIGWVAACRMGHFSMVWIGMRPYNSSSISQPTEATAAAANGTAAAAKNLEAA